MSADNIESINYIEEGNTLVVTSKSGRVTTYNPVNPESYAEVIKSDCLNRAINNLIRHTNLVGVNYQRGN